MVKYFQTKDRLYCRLHYDVSLSFKRLMSLHNVDTVSHENVGNQGKFFSPGIGPLCCEILWAKWPWRHVNHS